MGRKLESPLPERCILALVLDDIFSAVDVHTAQHLHRHALTRPLATGRTRILATHHVGICLPDTGYIVYLQNGMVEFAGKPTDLQDNAVLEAVLRLQSVDDEDEPSAIPQQELDRPRSAESRPESHHEAQAFVRKERGEDKYLCPPTLPAVYLGEWQLASMGVAGIGLSFIHHADPL